MAADNLAEPPVPDRYADAVRARRAELRGVRALLLGGHRVELRQCVTASRLAASADLAEALAGLGRELRHHAARADRAGRAALPSLAGAAVGRLVDRVVAGWAVGLLAGLRRLAAPRCGPGASLWPAVTAVDPVVALVPRRPSVALPGPDPPVGAARALLDGRDGRDMAAGAAAGGGSPGGRVAGARGPRGASTGRRPRAGPAGRRGAGAPGRGRPGAAAPVGGRGRGHGAGRAGHRAGAPGDRGRAGRGRGAGRAGGAPARAGRRGAAGARPGGRGGEAWSRLAGRTPGSADNPIDGHRTATRQGWTRSG